MTSSRHVRIGLLSTWNQQCGLATYARYLFSEIGFDHCVVLAESHVRQTRDDEPFVRRCWTRASGAQQGADYSRLLAEVEREQIEVLHINAHANFFHYPAFSQFLSTVRGRGVKVIAQLHNTFTVEAALTELVSHVDSVIVHTPENRLEVVANGASPDRVAVIQHGVYKPRKNTRSRSERRGALALPENVHIITSFGFIQPHKGMEAVLEVVLHLKSRGIPSKGVIVGSPRDDDPNSNIYLTQLRNLVAQHGLQHDVEFVTRYVVDEEVAEYLSVSDLVVMNYKSQHFEASGACSLAVGAGVPVMTSLAPAMMSFGDAVWHLTAGYPPGVAAELILTNSNLRDELRAKAETYAHTHAWSEVAKKIVLKYRELTEVCSSEALASKETRVTQDCNAREVKGNMKILIQNRPQTFSLRGGDTVVIEKLKAGLESRGIQVSVDVEGREDPKDFDLVHIFNFATPDITKAFAQNAKAAGRPYVVTTLYEDLPTFHNQSHYYANLLVQYVERGQDNTWWRAQDFDLAQLPKAPSFNNAWVAENAAALICNGETEAQALRRDYPQAKKILEVKLGHEVGDSADPKLFVEQYGVKDFIFCVGRFESRKNQLMVLKALENVELPLVLASGGFSYQPEYDKAVRQFQRKGPTIIVDRLSPEMLASAYAACRVHVLASWYELPGLVSLEAASRGKNVVVTHNGTAPDYFRTNAFYCNPADEESIRNAVLAAYYTPAGEGVSECARSYTWDCCVAETVEAYRKVLGLSAALASPSAGAALPSSSAPRPGVHPAAPSAVYDYSENAAEFQELLEKGELAAKNVDFETAHDLLGKAEVLNPRSVRVLKARGAILLAESKVSEAREYFDRALAVDPKEPKALAGRGMCEMMNRSVNTAMPYFIRALEITPDHLVALHQMVECAYALNSFVELENVLSRYLSVKPDDNEMRYCFAGCLYKQGKSELALAQCERVLGAKPSHESARELKDKIESEGQMRSGSAGDRPIETSARPKLISGTGIADSLSDLSKMITEWKVDAARAGATPPAPKSTVLVTSGDDLGGSAQLMRPSLEQVVSKPMVVGGLVSSSVPELSPEAVLSTPSLPPVAPMGGAEVTFLEIEDLKRERRFEEAGLQLDGVLSRTGLTPAQKARAQSTKAELMAITGDIAGADTLYDIVLREYPDFPRALCGKGALAAEEQRWAAAKELFERAHSLDPNYDVPLAGLAICEMADNRADAAFSLFKRANQLNPENHRAILGLIQLGYPLQEFGAIESAISTFLDHHPVNIDMMYSLAGVYYAQNKLNDARAEIEKILLFEPANERAVELQGMIESKWQSAAAGSVSLSH